MSSKPPIGLSVGSLVPRATKKALEKFGFPAAAILTDWSLIVGTEFAAFTEPERLRWPRGIEASLDDDVGEGPSGATLVLRVEGPRSLEVQLRSAQLIERINAHFGFLAVTDIRIVQAPLERRCSLPAATPQGPAPRLAIPSSELPDDRLRDVIERLGGSVHRAQSRD